MQKFNYHTHTRKCGHADNNMTINYIFAMKG